MEIKKNHGFVYVVFILGIFVIGLAWVLLSRPMQYTYDTAYNSTYLEDEVYQEFFIRTKTIWSWILLPIGLALIIGSILKIMQRNMLDGMG